MATSKATISTRMRWTIPTTNQTQVVV